MGDLPARDRDFLFHLPSALPFTLRPPGHVVIVDSRSGADHLIPGAAGARRVTVVEENSALAAYLRKRQAGGAQAGSNLVHGSGRRFLARLSDRPDVILLSRVGFVPSGAGGLPEDFHTTVEAFLLYLSVLEEQGLLLVQTYLLPPPRYELRLFANLTEALKGYGTSGAPSDLVVYRSWDTLSFLVKKGRFTGREWSDIRGFVRDRQFQVLFPDGEEGGPFVGGPDYRSMFRDLADPSRAAAFREGYPFGVGPTTDDRPFFYYLLKVDRLREVYHLSGRKWAYFIHEGMALPFLLIILAVLSVAMFLGVFAATERNARRLTSLPYFGAIGLAFMFLEVFFIHRLILVFGSSPASFSVTLLCLLAGAGGGSMTAPLFGPGVGRTAMAGAPVLACLLYAVPDLLSGPFSSCLVLVITGCVLGIYFPLGLARFGRSGQGVPLLYATNGAASVIAAPLASLIAAAWGLKMLLLLAAGFYVLSLVITFVVPARS